MSGGHFDYIQFRIDDAAEDIERIVRENDWDGGFNQETIERFKEAAKIFRKAAIYMQRVDWLLCGDDGEDSFHERLEQELKELEDTQ